MSSRTGAFPIGFAAMLDQYRPAESIKLAVQAEKAGFTGAIANDHYQPRLPQQGQAGHMWSVLGALGTHIRGPFGGVTTPTFRTHPAIVAQAAATIADLYGPRYWLGIGSGEAISEHVVAPYWPEAPERIARMFEAIDVIRKLFASRNRDVRHDGRYFSLEAARLWTMPETPPDLLVATSGPVTARRAGRVADGIVTVEAPRARLELLLERFATGVRESGRQPESTQRILQLHVSYAQSIEQAELNAVREWPQGALRFPTVDVRSPFDFAQMARYVRPEDFEGRVFISSDPDAHRQHLQHFVDLGFTHIYVHNVGRNQDEFIATYAQHVIGKVRA